MDYQELQKQTVVKLREMAKEYPDVEGASGMKKEQLVDMLCDKMGIEKPHAVAVGVDKAEIKKKIAELKKVRDEALQKKDRQTLIATRRKLHQLRRKLRKAVKVV
ncbi:MAG: hypothetical protein GF330_04705 [Candidatus Eisenbacteria bacterium]|nr:hypothetical protein [Candidatus Eisenbacteria bacterium]